MIREDWSNIKKRWEAWWNCDIYDRPVMQAVAPKDFQTPVDLQIIKDEKDLSKRWGDADHIIKREKNKIENTFYGGEMLPFVNPGWSVGHAAFLGCEPHFGTESVWVDPLSRDEDIYPELVFDQGNYWWKWFLDYLRKAVDASDGNYYLLPHHGNMTFDTLALVRGTENLLVDIATNPEWVKSSMKAINDFHKYMYGILFDKISKNKVEGCINFGNVWAPGKNLGFDADTACMISNDHFKDFVLPSLLEIMDLVDYRFYHLDGIGNFRHLDTLLDIPELQAIQWVPGDGHWEVMQWLPELKKIQKRKKAIQVFATPEEVLPLLKELRPEGLCLLVSCKSESEAKRLIENVEKLYK